MKIDHEHILRHIDQLVILQDQLFRNTKSEIMKAYHDGALNMAKSIRQFVAIDKKIWTEIRDEEREEDARLDRIAEDKEQERFSDDSSY